MLRRTSAGPRQRRDHRDEARRRDPPRPPRHCRRRAPARPTRARSTNPSSVRSRKRGCAVGSTRRLYGSRVAQRCAPCNARIGDVRRRRAASAPGRARYRRTRPDRPTSDRRAEGGPVVGGRRHGTPAPGADARCRDQAAATDLVVEAGDRPAPRSVLERQRQPGSRRVDLEQGARPADHGIGGGLLADDREARDRESLVAPRDLARATVEPVGPDLDLDRLDTDECHLDGSFPGAERWVVSSGALVRQNVCSVVTGH